MTDIRTQAQGAVFEIAFERPARRNAITAAMYDALSNGIARAEGNRAIRVMLLHGTADVFTAGNDIEDFVQRPPQGEDAPVFRFLRTMSQAKKPIVAAVNGPAVGIGTTLLLHCDLVYAAEDARFQLPFISLGVVPEFASSYLLPLVAEYQRAAELMLLGEPFDARKAYECGFITRLVPATETLSTARAAAARLASLPGKSVRAAKALMKAPHSAAVAAQLQAESVQFRTMLSEPAAREALAAFLEKRKPVFRQENGDDR